MAYSFFPQFNPFGFNSNTGMNNNQYNVSQYQQQPQILRVQSEEQARQYPVAAGNSITFIDENKPYCYTKSMGFSQLEPPMFEKYRLVKEMPAEMHENAPEAHAVNDSIDLSAYATKAEIGALNKRYEELCAEVERIKSNSKEMNLCEQSVDKE